MLLGSQTENLNCAKSTAKYILKKKQQWHSFKLKNFQKIGEGVNRLWMVQSKISNWRKLSLQNTLDRWKYDKE